LKIETSTRRKRQNQRVILTKLYDTSITTSTRRLLPKRDDELFENFCWWWYRTDDECQIEYFLSAVVQGKLDEPPEIRKGNVVPGGFFTNSEGGVEDEEEDEKFREGKLKNEFIRYYSLRVAKPEANLKDKVGTLLGKVHDDLVKYLKKHEFTDEPVQFKSARELFNLIGAENVLVPAPA
jgi:hypothetical protein